MIIPDGGYVGRRRDSSVKSCYVSFELSLSRSTLSIHEKVKNK
jgi:hypothetical protein